MNATDADGRSVPVVIEVSIRETVPGDVNADGVVGQADLRRAIEMLQASDPRGDLNGDGRVSGDDLAVVVSNFGRKARTLDLETDEWRE